MEWPNLSNALAGNLKSKIQNPKLPRRSPALIAALLTLILQWPAMAHPQSKPMREIKVGYPLGGSSSYFWVAYRSGGEEGSPGVDLLVDLARGTVLDHRRR